MCNVEWELIYYSVFLCNCCVGSFYMSEYDIVEVVIVNFFDNFELVF